MATAQTCHAASNLLMEEHQVILSVIALLDRQAELLSDGEDVPVNLLRESVRFFRDYADHRHHGKEEDLLFTALVREGQAADDGPVAAMIEEHVAARQLVTQFEYAVEDYAEGQDNTLTDIIADLNTAVLRRQFDNQQINVNNGTISGQ